MNNFQLHKTEYGYELEDIIIDEEDSNTRLSQFCSLYCSGINEKTMQKMIELGKNLGAQLVDAAKDTEKWQLFLKEHATIESAANFIWLLTSQTSKQEAPSNIRTSFGDLFTSGSMRIGTQGALTAKKLEEFLRACGGTSTYLRISTHMPEFQVHQFGLDFPVHTLPSNDATLLFFALPDNTFFIKPEEFGTPPICQDGFNAVDTICENIKHVIDYVCTRPTIQENLSLKNPFSRKVLELPPRKEHTPKKVLEQFNKTIHEIYKSSSIVRTLCDEGAKYGISKIYEIITTSSAPTSDAQNEKNRMIKLLEPYIRKAQEIGYTGTIKGDEVFLPPLGTDGCYWKA